MDVEVGHALAAVGTVVDRDAIAVRQIEFFCESRGRQHQMAEQSLVGRGRVAEARDVLFRNDQHMYRSLRLDVMDCDTLLVFMGNSGRDFAVDDFLENRFGHEKEFYHKGTETQRSDLDSIVELPALLPTFVPLCLRDEPLCPVDSSAIREAEAAQSEATSSRGASIFQGRRTAGRLEKQQL